MQFAGIKNIFKIDF